MLKCLIIFKYRKYAENAVSVHYSDKPDDMVTQQGRHIAHSNTPAAGSRNYIIP